MSIKSLLTELSEAIDRHRARKRSAHDSKRDHNRPVSTFSRVVRWLTPNGGTLLLVIALVFTARVWAKPMVESATTSGESATTINYQGHLADSEGNPKQGTYSIEFAIYDDRVAGNLIWGPEKHGTVDVEDGLFSVGLGSLTTGGIPTSVWNGDRYLEIVVDDETLTPRELIRSVPIAGMALTVPEGAIKAEGLDLDSGTDCLSEDVYVELVGNWERESVPGLELNFTLDSPGQVLVWIDGLAHFNADDESDVGLRVDDTIETSAYGDGANRWYNVKGQRLLNLDSGPHSVDVQAYALNEGIMRLNGRGGHQTCISYLVLGHQ